MTDRPILIIGGMLLVVLAVPWDMLRGNPWDFDLSQITMMTIGFFVSILGFQPSKIVRINFYILIGLCAVVLIVLELVLSNNYSQSNIDSASSFDYELDKFNQKYVFSENAQVLREIGFQNELDFVYKKTSNVNLSQKQGHRIIILGDSYVMGAGMVWGGTWDGLSINYLEKLAPDVELISFGRNGASTEDQYKFLMSNIDLLDPDLVVFTYVSNDPHFKKNEITKAENRIRFIEKFGVVTGYPYRLKSLNYIYKRVNNLFISYYPYYGYEGWVKRLYEQDNFDAFEKLLAEIGAASNTNKFDVMFYIFPSLRYKSQVYQQYLSQLLDGLDKNKIDYLNPLNHFYGTTDTFSRAFLKANPGDAHPGTLTNYLATRYFFSYMCDKNVLPQECVNYQIDTLNLNR